MGDERRDEGSRGSSASAYTTDDVDDEEEEEGGDRAEGDVGVRVPGRRHRTALRVGRGEWLFLTVALWPLLFSSTMVYGMCPARCQCRDDILRASCVDTGLEVVPIQLNPDLREIDVHGNRITNVDYTLSIYQNLRLLDLSSNKITYLGKHNFELQEKLSALNVSGNQITVLKKGVFKGLESLRTLDLSRNELRDIEHGSLHDMRRLELLDLSHNKITEFQEEIAFKTLNNLRILSLTGNELLQVPGVLLKHLPNPSLEVLELSDNLIGDLMENSFPASAVKNLKALSLAANVIGDVHGSSFNALHSLSFLDLGYNNLSAVPTQQLAKLSRLTELDLSGNAFTTLPPVAFQSLFQLTVLRLSRMPYLSLVDARAFVDNIHLESVVMNENPRIAKLPSRTFLNNPHLTNVALRRNSLSTLDASHFPLDRLRTLDVSGNPFNCNCSLLWLWKLAEKESTLGDRHSKGLSNETVDELMEEGTRTTDGVSLTVDGLRCNAPDTLRGTLLVDAPESAFLCEPTWTAVVVVTAFVVALFAAFCLVLLLISGTEWHHCGREKDGRDLTGADTVETNHRLASAAGHPPLLMLVPGSGAADKQVGAATLGFMDSWPVTHVTTTGSRNEYVTATSRKSPHIVYV